MREKAIQLINKAHKEDPDNKELIYSEQCFEWLKKLKPDYKLEHELAARCQHLKRWEIPRSSYPMDKKGYHQWRIKLYSYQAEQAEQILKEAKVDDAIIQNVKEMVAKKDLRKNENTQLIEDVACLVFLEHYIQPFAKSKDYNEEKWIKIIRKTWAKMSDKAHKFALEINYPQPILQLIQKAIA